jgi:cytoskeletal protein CcmA (bactofilin family)
MVKNLPAVERSTKIRFGKNVPDSTDQAENTIVFNASNTLVPTINENAVYLSPIRNRPDFTPPEVVLLMYDKVTKEITESGESANALVGGATLSLTVDRANVTSNTVQFRFAENNTGFVTDSNVGISNLLPQHTVSVGSNLYIDEFGSNVLVVSGNVAILRDLVVDGNFRVNGDTTVIYTENTAIKDAFIELGADNITGDTTLDLGILMHRPDDLSNVVLGYREEVAEFAIAYTDAKPTDKIFTPKSDEDINVHVYGLTHIDANIYAHEDLLVSGNVYVSQNVSVTEELTVSGNVYTQKDVEILGNTYVSGNVSTYKDLLVSGNAYVSQNIFVTEELTVSGNVYTQKDVEILGNTYVSGNVSTYKDLLVSGNAYVSQNVFVTEELTVSGNVYTQKDVEILGNTYVSGNVSTYKDLLVSGNAYVSQNVFVTEELTVSGNVYTQKDVEILGNTYVSGNVSTYKDLLVSGNAYVSQNVFITEELTVSGNVYTQKDVEILGNTYVSGNVSTYKDLLVSGNAYVSQNVFVTEEMTVSGNVYTQKDVEILGNTYVSGNVSTYKDLLVSGNAYVSQNVFVTEELTVFGNVYTQKDVEILGNTYVSGNVSTYKDLLVSGNAYVSQNVFVTEELTVSGNVYTQKDVEILGNTYVSGNVSTYKDLLVSGNAYVSGNVDVTKQLSVSGNAYISGNVEVTKSLIVSGNTHLEGDNIFITHTMDFLDPATAIVTDLNSNVEVKLNQLANVVIGEKALANEDMLVYDGSNWTNQLQDHTFLYAKAEEVIDKGDVVYATGTVGNNTFSIRKARADSSTTMPALGLAYQDFTVNGQGLIVTFGRADGVNTDNFQTGETVYVSNVTAGVLSNVKPYGATDLIQNIGVVVKGHPSTGIVSVTGVGRSNDIPNAVIETSNASVNYVYVNSENNDLRKIDPMKLPTKFQTLAQVVNTGNTVSNTINVTGLTTTGNVNVTSNISVAGLIDPNNKYLPMVDTNGYFVKSPVYVTNEGKYIISASEAEFLGNITLGGNTTIISSTSVTIEDRIFGVGANNSATGLDSGFMIEHQDDDIFANIALIHHADEHRFSIGYTQNSFTDNHILHYQHTDGTQLRIDLLGNTLVQNNLTVNENSRFSGKVGIKTGTPGYDLDVRGTSNVGALSADSVSISDTTAATGKTSGALQVTGGVGIQGALYGAAGNFDGVTSVTNTSASSSKTTGALRVTGGVGIQGALYGAAGNFDGVTSVTNTSAATGKTNGALRVAGGVGIQGALYGANANLEDVEADSVNITDSTASSSKTTGALRVTGGVGIQGALYGAAGNFDGVTSVTNVTASTSKTTGALQVAGGVGIQGALYGANANLEDVEADSVNITDSTASSSKTTGALQVAGGVGIQGALYGAAGNFDGVTSVTNTSASSSKTTGALRVAGGVGIQGALYGANANLEDVEADSVNITDSTASSSKTTGALRVAGGVGIQGALYGANANLEDVEADSVNITDSTASSSKTTGALQVAGGVGIQGALYGANANLEDVEADSVNITDSTASSSKTTGALQVAGGVGIQGTLYANTLFTDQNIVHTGDTNTYIGFPANDAFRIVTNNNERLRVDSSGNIGINDSTPSYKLDVNGTGRFTGLLTGDAGVSVPSDGDFIMNSKPLVPANSLHWDQLNNRLGVGTNIPATKLHVAGGTIINSDGVAKKTYSYSGDLGAGQTIANSTITITFSAHVFYAKIVAHLTESDNEVSTLSLECGGGHWTGGTPLAIAKGPQAIFGSASTNPWDSAVTTTTTTVSFKPTTTMAVAGHYNVFIEYISQSSSGVVSKITEGSTDVVTFGY